MILTSKHIDCVPTQCYNLPEEVNIMAIENKESVREYHKQLKDMKIRFPKASEEFGIPDYAEAIKQQASMLGKSANEYILDLIQEDIRTNEEGLKDSNFTIVRDIRAIKSLKDNK